MLLLNEYTIIEYNFKAVYLLVEGISVGGGKKVWVLWEDSVFWILPCCIWKALFASVWKLFKMRFYLVDLFSKVFYRDIQFLSLELWFLLQVDSGAWIRMKLEIT